MPMKMRFLGAMPLKAVLSLPSTALNPFFFFSLSLSSALLPGNLGLRDAYGVLFQGFGMLRGHYKP